LPADLNPQPSDPKLKKGIDLEHMLLPQYYVLFVGVNLSNNSAIYTTRFPLCTTFATFGEEKATHFIFNESRQPAVVSK